MAHTAGECVAMIDAAEKAGIVLAVGLMRRFLWGHRFARELIASGRFGRVRSFSFSEGSIYDWPVASDFFFRKDSAGGGVPIDTGAHTLDSLLQWLGPAADVEYFDDAEGGVEANCLLKLRMQSGATGTVELSRTRRLRNAAIIQMEGATLEVALAANHVKMGLADQPYLVGGPVAHLDHPGLNQDYLTSIADQLRDWIDAIRKKRPPVVDARSALESVQLIETCYRHRQPLVLEWDDVSVPEVS